MNKVFEKIIEKQKELFQDLNVIEVLSHVDFDSTIQNSLENFLKAITNEAIEIVKQEAEKYNNGWVPCSERLPDSDKNKYIVQKTNGITDILGFTKDAYKLSRYDFAEYKGKKKQLFYGYDSEYGYIEWECEAWQPLPQPYQPKGE